MNDAERVSEYLREVARFRDEEGRVEAARLREEAELLAARRPIIDIIVRCMPLRESEEALKALERYERAVRQDFAGEVFRAVVRRAGEGQEAHDD